MWYNCGIYAILKHFFVRIKLLFSDVHLVNCPTTIKEQSKATTLNISIGPSQWMRES